MDRYGYETPGDGSQWIKCAMCDRPFKVFRYQLREGTKFCSRFCCWAAQRAFTRALADGRLSGILAEERERAKTEAGASQSGTIGRLRVEAREYARKYLPAW
jgi:hypothetical protein